jgi:hypothetical protein
MKTTTIRASVKVSPKIRDTFYSIEYMEERSVDESEQDKIEELRSQLFDDVYNTCVMQINDIIDAK